MQAQTVVAPLLRRIPLAGEMGPDFSGSGTPQPATVSSRWDRHPVALAIVVVFLAILAYKVAR